MKASHFGDLLARAWISKSCYWLVILVGFSLSHKELFAIDYSLTEPINAGAFHWDDFLIIYHPESDTWSSSIVGGNNADWSQSNTIQASDGSVGEVVSLEIRVRLNVSTQLVPDVLGYQFNDISVQDNIGGINSIATKSTLGAQVAGETIQYEFESSTVTTLTVPITVGSQFLIGMNSTIAHNQLELSGLYPIDPSQPAALGYEVYSSIGVESWSIIAGEEIPPIPDGGNCLFFLGLSCYGIWGLRTKLIPKNSILMPRQGYPKAGDRTNSRKLYWPTCVSTASLQNQPR